MKKKDWREFEKLISRIESLLSPKGAVVKSPDRLRDKVTGQLREVDASIRYNVGSVQILLTIECRKRKATSDDTWIEQLATKKQKIGASHTIAVSSTGFTEPAIKSAQLFGIELRTIKTITNEDILSWIDKIKITNIVLKAIVETLRAKVYDPDPDSQLDPSIVPALKKENLKAKILFYKGDNKKVCIAEVLEMFVKMYNPPKEPIDRANVPEKIVLEQGDSFTFGFLPDTTPLFFGDIPDNGLKVKKTIEFHFPEGEFSILTTKGPKYVKQLQLDLVLYKVVEEIPISRKVQYSSTEETVSNIVEADIKLFKHDRKEDFILSYTLPKQENAPITFLISGEQDE